MHLARLLLASGCLLHVRAAAAPPATGGKGKQTAPALDLEAAWKKDAVGFSEMIAFAAKSAKNEEQVIVFVQAKFAAQWKLSSPNNAYRPLRDVISKSVEWTKTPGMDVARANKVLHEALSRLDKANDDNIPDFLYKWLQPAAAE